MSSSEFTIRAFLVDVVNRSVKPSEVTVKDGIIKNVETVDKTDVAHFLMPGFVDSHIHIESSMLLPSQFARTAVLHGTVATVSDPHEIANVCGIDGVELMLRDASGSPFKFYFGAPACVPASNFETAGATMDADVVAKLLDDPRIAYLSEMMDFPGVLSESVEVFAKISAAQKRGKPVDGHAPGLRGEEARKYFAAGISTDHESYTLEEAIEKIQFGCKIAIREGSAARNFEALEPLIDQYPDLCMFCSDDKHPDELLLGHINQLAARAVKKGRDLMNVLQACSLNGVKHYRLNVGLLQPGDPADFIVVSDLNEFQVLETYIDGELVAKDGECLMPVQPTETINKFAALPISPIEIVVEAATDQIRVIEVLEGQLITNSAIEDARIENGYAVSDPERDLLKLVVLNRYHPAKPAIGFVRGFNIKQGAFASSVAHDSHNVLAVGTSDRDLASAINSVIREQGGLAVCRGNEVDVLPLPVAGLMTTESCEVVAEKYSQLDRHVKGFGCTLKAPFMTLSFLALLVIPSLKLSDRGLFDVDKFEFTSLFVD